MRQTVTLSNEADHMLVSPLVSRPYSLPFSHRLLIVLFFLFESIAAEQVWQALRER